MKRLNVTNGYVCCPVENRQGLLLELLNRHYDQQDKAWNKKIVIVFSHDNCVRFYTELFQRLKQLPIIPLLKANLKSQGGLDDYSLFLEAETAVIAVSTRTALQLPGLTADKIIQYEPPLSLQSVSSLSSMCSDYLLFLRPQEVSFVEELRRSGGALSSMSEQFVPWDSVRKLPKQKVQQWYKNIHSMNINSKAAYKAYMDSIRDHQLSDIFNLEGVLIKEVAQGYCFVVPPFYKLVNETPRHDQELERKKLQSENMVIPKTAKVVKTSFLRVVREDDQDPEAVHRRAQSKAAKQKAAGQQKRKRVYREDEVVIHEDGTVELGRDQMEIHNLHKHRRMIIGKAKKSDMRALKRQMNNTEGIVKTSTRIGNKKRRRPIKIPRSMKSM